MCRNANNLLLIGLAAFLLSVVTQRLGYGRVNDFASGLFTGVAIVCMLVGVYRTRQSATKS